jgi:GT2 family glycosyltransferase
MPELLTPRDVAIAIPTYGRDQVLLDTITACVNQKEPAGEILVIDQTPEHEAATARTLHDWHDRGVIRWEKRTMPSQPGAMNHALRVTGKPLLLFLDDDVVPAEGFIRTHVDVHNQYAKCAVVGQIIQPWQTPTDITPPACRSSLTEDFDFPFHTTRACWLKNAMSGHLSVVRDLAMEVGGFDENFKGAAYRFDTEFARRVIHHGGRVRFCPGASLRHLRAERGGTRVHGNHLASADPIHGVGDYYFAMLQGWNGSTTGYMARRMVREVATKFHLRHPWYIPVKLVGEFRAFLWALQLKRQGPAHLQGGGRG